tara:strand:- start:408 stop:800 length:393 start_codon:yes stop_codon:yes gene_type:complete
MEYSSNNLKNNTTNTNNKMASERQINLPNTIKSIVLHFIKVHYKQYLDDNKLTKIPDDELEEVVYNLYDDKQLELKKYIRGTMRKNFPDYDSNFTMKTTTEEIILEMFDDPDYSKSRLVLEIKNYQETLN